MPSIETPIKYKLRVQWRLVMIFTAVLIITAFLVEFWIILGKRDEVIQDASSYLVPLPQKIEWTSFEGVFDTDYSAQQRLELFLRSLDRTKVKVGSVQ